MSERDELLHALRLAADAMRRSDPVYCEALDVEQVSDADWDNALACVEDALDALNEHTASPPCGETEAIGARPMRLTAPPAS